MTMHQVAALTIFSALLATGCAEQKVQAPSADRFYTCADVNGPIGTLQLTQDGKALVHDGNAPGAAPILLGPYQQQKDAVIIKSTDFGAITYRESGGKLVLDPSTNSSPWTSQVTCISKAK